jgi:integrase
MPLSDLAIRNAKATTKPVKISDGGGLQLLVQPSGSKLWRLAYRFDGRQKQLALGSYATVSLKEARAKRDEAKKLLANSVDPAVLAKLEKVRRQVATANTFGLVADEYLDKQRQEQRAQATISKTIWLLSLARPALGNRPISEISAAEVLLVLQKVAKRGHLETARRLRSMIGRVFALAIITGRAFNEPTGPLRGALAAPKVTHRPAVTNEKDLGALLRAIDGFTGQPTTTAALKLMALLFPRPGELRFAIWSEFDFATAVWTIPAERTKMRRQHRVPLPRQALAILEEMKAFSRGGRYVFPSVRTIQRPMCENTLNAALRRLGYAKDEMTAHGFRATASTILNESGKWSADAIERALGHIEPNAVRRAYARGEHQEERVRMMQDWADHLDELRVDIRPAAIAHPENNG